MDPMDVIKKAREGMNLRTVFGEPITHDDLVIIPVTKISGGPEADPVKERRL